MKRGQKVYPSVSSVFSFLGREDVHNQVIPIEEPTRAKDVENVKNRVLVPISWSHGGRGQHRWGRGSRRGRGSLLSPLRGQGRGQGKTTRRRHTEMMVVRKQEAELLRVGTGVDIVQKLAVVK